MDKRICNGLAKVCEMLARYKKTTPDQKKDFLRYAQTFRNFTKIKKSEAKMSRKLTDFQKEEREVNKVVKRIKTLEKVYSQKIVERACMRYKGATVRKRSAEKRVKELQKEIEKAKKDLK